MRKNSSIFNFNSLPKAFSLFFFLCAIFEILVFKFHEYPVMHRIKKILIETQKINADILFLGDSSITRDIDVNEFERITKKKIYTYGTTASFSWPQYYLLLKDYLKCQPHPKYVILMSVPMVWSKDLNEVSCTTFTKHYFPHDLRIFNLVLEGYPIVDFIEGYFIRPLPSIQYRDYLNKKVLSLFQKKEIQKDFESDKETISGLIANKGTSLGDGVFTVTKNGNKNFFLRETNLLYFNKIAKLLNDLQIKYAYAVSPIAEDSFTKRETSELKKINQKLIETHPGLIFLQPEVLLYANSDFLDTDAHLNRKSALPFTQKMAEEFNRQFRNS